jgi:PAS domain S-box-containing protein
MNKRLRVLVVEDNLADVDLIREYMADSGPNRFQIDSVARLSEALARLEGESYDLLLIDLGLPDSRGLTTFNNLRKAAPNTPTIILTGYDDEETAVTAVRNGAQDYLIKGQIIGNMLIRAAQYAMERKRAEETLQESESRYRELFEAESDAIVLIDNATGNILEANSAAAALYGYDHAEFLTKRNTDLSAEPDETSRVTRETPISSDQVVTIPLRFHHKKDGTVFPTEITGRFFIREGRSVHIVAIRDITERKRAEEKLMETLGRLRTALGGIIQVLSATTEKRDPYTAGHQKRVADLARAIGEEMGLAAERVEGLRLAGTIHDVGKVSIPAEILSKPGSLTEYEYKLIQDHPKVGHDILRDINFSWPLAEMVLQHHERLNGSGYPQRLKGENILLEARILAVSDVVEAMASHRPYRPALGIAAALEEMEKNKGILFDADVVSACLALFREKGFSFK